MIEHGKPETSEAAEQARAKAQQLAAAFEETFGQPRTRSATQKLVFEHLEKVSGNGDEGNCFSFASPFDGIKTALAAAHIDGAKSVLRIIRRQLSISANVKAPKPDKVKVKR